jgi:DNA polymerase-4
MVKSFESVVHPKFMVGDVTTFNCFLIGIRTIQTLSEMPARCCSRWLVKNDRYLKSKRYWQSVGALYGEESFRRNTPLQQDTIEFKIILVGMVEKLAFQLRSEEWPSTVVIKYAILILIPKQSNESHLLRLIILTRSVTELFDKLYQRRMRLRLLVFALAGWFAERTKSICLKIRNVVAVSGDGSNEKTLRFWC